MKNRKILQTVGATVGVLVIGFSLPLNANSLATCPEGYTLKKLSYPYSSKDLAQSACESWILGLQDIECHYVVTGPYNQETWGWGACQK